MFGLALGTGAVTLSFAVAASHAYYSWAAALVWPPQGDVLAQIASLNATYWGFVYTAMLATAGGYCAYRISTDIESARIPEGKKRDEWLKEQGILFQPADRLVAVVLASAPLLTSPLLDMVKAVAGGSG
jgi:hypothetical protein